MRFASTQTYSRTESDRLPHAVDNPPPLVALAEVSRYLGNISRSTVYKLVATGQLKRVRIGSRAFVAGESITALLSTLLSDAGTTKRVGEENQQL